MNVLPPCAYYLRRVLKCTHKSQNILDLLQTAKEHSYSLEGRLHFLYPGDYSYRKVILHLEQLIYSHQHAQTYQDRLALQDITGQILWWLGYGITIHPTDAKVLVVDDTIETLKLVTTLLAKAGYKTDSALNGQLALAKIPLLNPNLILLDVNLPDMDGYRVYQKLQESSETADIPVIFLSGVDNINNVQSQSQSRVGYLPKPFKPSSLLKYVSRYLEVWSPTETLTAEMLTNELESRQRYARRLIYLSDANLSKEFEVHGNDAESTYFFRATLDGRYLRVSQAFSQLCGYSSAEDMIASVTNLWNQVYENSNHQKQWSICLQTPNRIKTLLATVKIQQGNSTVDVIEKVCFVQDNYNRPLFYQGYMTMKHKRTP